MLPMFQMANDWWGGWPTWQSFLYACWRPLGLLCLLTLLMMSLVGLLAIWTGLGRGHWFLRTAVVLGWISLLMTIPAFELVIIYVLQAGLTTVALVAWRNWRVARRRTAGPSEPTMDAAKRSPWQFSILDLLLLMVLVAWLSTMLTRTPLAVWTSWRLLLTEGVITAVLTIAAAWVGLSNGRWWLRLPLFLLLLPAALMSAWLGLWRIACRSPAGSFWESCKTRLSQAVLLVASLAMLAPLVAVGWRLDHPHTFLEPTRPSPNGYDELVQAANSIKMVNSPNFETATRAQLKTFVTQCGPVYAPVRVALNTPCQVPLRFDMEDFSTSVSKVQSLRQIARALYAQGQLAAIEGRNKDAITSYTDAIRLGRATMRGGLIVDALVGITFEGMGREGIAKMRKSLSAEECFALLARLSDLLDRPVPWEEFSDRDAAWTDKVGGWQWRLVTAIDKLARRNEPHGSIMKYAADLELARSRLLLCELAIRAYSLQHGRNPAALADLVPSYLPKAPNDPFDGGDFIYRLTPKGYELHSREIGIQGQPISADN